MLPSLNDLLDSLRIIAPFDVVQPGDTLPLSLSPDLTRALTDLTNGIAIKVSIPNVELVPQSLMVKPVLNPPPPVGAVTLTPLDVTGKLVTTLTGTLTIAPALQQLPVPSIQWRVEDVSGNAVPDHQAHFLAPATDLATRLVFMPRLTALTTAATLEFTEYRIFCTVTVNDASVTVGPVRVRVPLLPIPLILLMSDVEFPFVHDAGVKNYFLVAVPASSPFVGIENLIPPLRQAQSVLNRVRMLLGGTFESPAHGLEQVVGDLLAILKAPAAVSFERRDQISKLEKVIADPGWFFGLGEVNLANRLSSVLLIGPTGQKVAFYQAKYAIPDGKKWFEVTIGNELHCIIKDLNQLNLFDPRGAQVKWPEMKEIVNDPHQNDIMNSFRFFTTPS